MIFHSDVMLNVILKSSTTKKKRLAMDNTETFEPFHERKIKIIGYIK